MKKVIFVIFLSIVFVIGLTGCGKTKNEFNIGDKSDIIISESDVTMSIKDGTLTNTGATIILTNNSNRDFQYGNPYEIEIKKDGEWHKINVKLNFTLPSFGLKAKETKELKLNWENGYGKLASGNYRIVKSIDYESEKGKYESFNVTAEFNIDSD